MKIYEIDDGEAWWYAAESEIHALRLHLECIVSPGTDLSDPFAVNDRSLPCPVDEMEIVEFPDDKLLTIRDTDNDEIIAKTAAEWASEGAGLVGSTVW